LTEENKQDTEDELEKLKGKISDVKNGLRIISSIMMSLVN
jgi:hypothetical protein